MAVPCGPGVAGGGAEDKPRAAVHPGAGGCPGRQSKRPLPRPPQSLVCGRHFGNPSYLKKLVLKQRGACLGCFLTGLYQLTRAAKSPIWASLRHPEVGFPKETCDTGSRENRGPSEAEGARATSDPHAHETGGREGREELGLQQVWTRRAPPTARLSSGSSTSGKTGQCPDRGRAG